MILKTEIINVSNFDRVSAIIAYNGKLYISDCDHQEALEELAADIGQSTGLDWSDPDKFDEVQAEAIKITDSLFLENKIQGFSLYLGPNDELYLIAHYQENLESAYNSIKPYVDGFKCCHVGTFIDSHYNVKLLESM